MEAYDRIRELLQKLDIDPDGSRWGLNCYSVEEKIEEFQRIISPEIERLVKHSIKGLQELQKEIAEQMAGQMP